MTTKTLDKVRALPWVAYVDDEREIGNSIIVTLAKGWRFRGDCGVQGFDTVAQCARGCRSDQVEADE